MTEIFFMSPWINDIDEELSYTLIDQDTGMFNGDTEALAGFTAIEIYLDAFTEDNDIFNDEFMAQCPELGGRVTPISIDFGTLTLSLTITECDEDYYRLRSVPLCVSNMCSDDEAQEFATAYLSPILFGECEGAKDDEDDDFFEFNGDDDGVSVPVDFDDFYKDLYYLFSSQLEFISSSCFLTTELTRGLMLQDERFDEIDYYSYDIADIELHDSICNSAGGQALTVTTARSGAECDSPVTSNETPVCMGATCDQEDIEGYERFSKMLEELQQTCIIEISAVSDDAQN
uniref:Uncharacterized protein n=1 Tax=Chaetoceros debilis TaxID=122233 RepID=A0A7S3VBS1_9STRA